MFERRKEQSLLFAQYVGFVGLAVIVISFIAYRIYNLRCFKALLAKEDKKRD